MDRVIAWAPGSTSNVGPGFDCLGIAVTEMGDRIVAERTGPPGVRVRSVDDPRIPTGADRNTAAIAASTVLERAGAKDVGIELEVHKGLPLAGGLGGSAASAVGGAVAANALVGGALREDELLESALFAESKVSGGLHADNVAPCLLGGAVVVLSLGPTRYARTSVHPSLRLVLVMPGYGVATAEARAVLPKTVSRDDAVAQSAGLAALVLGLERGDGPLLREAMVDRIAEPARAPLYPGYTDARKAALAAGAWGVTVSGAGPTLVAIASEETAPAVGRAAARAYEVGGHEARVHVAGVDAEGARLL